MVKIGRNDPCPCGSGKKYKKCCQAQDEATDTRIRGEQSAVQIGCTKNILKRSMKSSMQVLWAN